MRRVPPDSARSYLRPRRRGRSRCPAPPQTFGSAPTGDHFLRLAANSPAVLAAFLAAIHRNDCLVMADIEEARAKVAAALVALDAVRAVQIDTAAPPGAG